MSGEREQLLYLMRIDLSGSTHTEFPEDQQETLNQMKRVIELNPELNADERNILSVVFKNIISSRRRVIHNLMGLYRSEVANGHTSRLARLKEYQNTLQKELDSYSLELIDIVERQLLPNVSEPDVRVFYEKLIADYYRYIAEFKTGDEKNEWAEKAKQHYETALDVSRSELTPSSPLHLGLVLNYSVFLYDTMDLRSEAIELAARTYGETIDAIDNMSEVSLEETTKIITLLRENHSRWTHAETM